MKRKDGNFKIITKKKCGRIKKILKHKLKNSFGGPQHRAIADRKNVELEDVSIETSKLKRKREEIEQNIHEQ